jgi:hypothetical protein
MSSHQVTHGHVVMWSSHGYGVVVLCVVYGLCLCVCLSLVLFVLFCLGSFVLLFFLYTVMCVSYLGLYLGFYYGLYMVLY